MIRTGAAGFEPLRDAFTADFTDQGELGAAVAVRLNGRTVADLWGGWADSERSRPWAAGTLTNVWSAAKGMTAICALRLVETGYGYLVGEDIRRITGQTVGERSEPGVRDEPDGAGPAGRSPQDGAGRRLLHLPRMNPGHRLGGNWDLCATIR